MTRSLRQRHRRMVTVIGVLLPIAFAAGISARKPAPTVPTLPAALVMRPQHFEAAVWERGDLFPKTAIRVRLLRGRAGTGRFAVEFCSAKDFVKPDLLVYWVTGRPNSSDVLPDNARLLGAFDPSTSLLLPEKAGSGSGVIVLYSLADNQIVDVSKPFGTR